MKYTASVVGFYSDRFSSLKAARAWIRDCYSRGIARGESRRYTIGIDSINGCELNLVDYGILLNGRLYVSK